MLVLFSGIKPKARAVTGWVVVEGSPVALRRGRRYRGCVVLPWYVPTSVVRSKLGPAMAERGFVDVAIVESKPAAWPEAECDFYVEATWGAADQAFDRPGAVALAWEARPA